MPSINSPVSIDPTRLQRAVAVAEDAVHSGPYPSAVIAVANAETTILTHAVSRSERAQARSAICNRVPSGRIYNCKENLWADFCLVS